MAGESSSRRAHHGHPAHADHRPPTRATHNTDAAPHDTDAGQTLRARRANPAAHGPHGSSQTGVPATTDMHFRDGAVAISYMSTLLLRLVDEGKVKLDDKVSKWLPKLRDGNRVTLRMLAAMTAGYHDYELDPLLTWALYTNPFGPITTQDHLRLALDLPQQFKPGTNWSYATATASAPCATERGFSRTRCSPAMRQSSPTCPRRGSRSPSPRRSRPARTTPKVTPPLTGQRSTRRSERSWLRAIRRCCPGRHGRHGRRALLRGAGEPSEPGPGNTYAVSRPPVVTSRPDCDFAVPICSCSR